MTDVLGWRRFLSIAGGVCVLIFGLGSLAERMVIGWTDDSAVRRAARTLATQVRAVDTSLNRVARSLAGREEIRRGLAQDSSADRGLFDVVRTAVGREPVPGLAITVYGPRGVPLAWGGRPGERALNEVRTDGAGFAAVGAAGLRLIRAEPVVDPQAPDGSSGRLGDIVVEQVLASSTTALDTGRGFRLDTAVGPATVDIAPGQGLPDGPLLHRFTVTDASGGALIAAVIDRDDIARTRARWRSRVLALIFLVLGMTMFVAGGRVLIHQGDVGHLRKMAIVGGTVLLGRGWFWLATPPDLFALSLFSPAAYQSVRWPWVARTPVDLLLTAGLFAALVALVADEVHRWRIMHRGGRRQRPAVWHAGTAMVVALLLMGQHWVLRDTVDGAHVDLLHTALQPFDSARLALQLALVLWSAATVWAVGVAVGLSLPPRPVVARRRRLWIVAFASYAPAVLVAAAGWAPLWPTLFMTGMGLVLALRWRRTMAWFRHTDPLARMVALLGAILLPTLPLYLALVAVSDDARRRLVEHDYAVQVVNHTQALREQILARTQQQIDAFPDLLDMATPDGAIPVDVLDTDRAFSIWRRTALAESRLSSAVELYGPAGALTSRFALNLPDYEVTASRLVGAGCEWGELFGHVAPFGSEERRLLHAERGLCAPGPDGRLFPAGAIVVHVAQVDYEALPFIASRSPYVELFQTGGAAPVAGEPGHGVELVVYGWGLQPTFVSDRSAWAIDEALFDRIYASRAPFWTRLDKDSISYDVLITNDRSGIHALGYPAHTGFDHLLHLSEIALLVLAAVGLLLAAVAGAGLLVPALRGFLAVREVRARFALKLQLWFVGVTTVPVVVVAVLIQGYFADQLRADVEARAAQTAAVARSVIEESAVLQPPDGQAVAPFTDDALVWISQVIGQGVNIFDGPQLVATSERDLYASGLLSTRTPDIVYRAIAIDQLSSFVGEDTIGARRYQLAAAPVRVGGREVILTVPLASRQQEIESQIDELNRRVWGSALFFAAVVGCIGWAIAKSIANPVRRLTRGTSRVARGEFHAPVSRRAELLRRRVAERSADELEILESDFNKMAGELDARRRQLERTHRLEAWSEMARQVAHEIKNPLTPVQLNAEHLLQVHSDHGSPLSPVLQRCVEAILKQVRILRQIASEFSSYASSPVAHRTPTALGVLVEEVIDPYRSGLQGRIDITLVTPPDLPVLQLDKVLMQRALTNIIENALHAMPGEGTLSVTAARHARSVELIIADTGVGLEPDVLLRIFEPYFSTKVSGTGLGMAIAKRNIELHGGSIAVASTRGRGTTVTMTFPMANDPDTGPVSIPDRTRAANSPGR